MCDFPDYYFRIRENGAAVFRVDSENRQRRLDMDQIAVVNLRSGEIRAQGERKLTERDRVAIADWVEARRAFLSRREMDDMRRMVDRLNLTAQWAQSRATPEQIAELSDALLLAMHDLRSVLVRRMTEGKDRDG